MDGAEHRDGLVVVVLVGERVVLDASVAYLIVAERASTVVPTVIPLEPSLTTRLK